MAQTRTRWGSGIDFTERAAKREQTRWSLTEWLAMKERNRLMDSWLAMNSPSPFEFMVGASHDAGKTELLGSNTQTSYTSYAGEFSAYAQLIGISAEHENNTAVGLNDLSGMINLRLLGNSIQNTSLTIHYGQRTRNQADLTERLVQEFAQASLQVYLTKYFGIDGKYRHYMPVNTNSDGEINGNLSEAGVFIDFKALRIFGSWYKESQKKKIPATSDESITDRTGIKSGIKIFF